jgi:large subunit ribosomal protein L10
MNREQKAGAIAEIAAQIEESQAVFAVDYRGISVPQVAELRAKLRDADATFRVVKNSLTERAADQTGTEELKPLLAGPTALTFVRGDAALAAKAIADYARLTQLLPFKGGLMDGAALDADQIRAISRLPSREVLYGQLVGVVASPLSGLVRTLGALVGGLAVALGQVREKKESGELPAGEPPAAVVEDAPATSEVAPAAKEAPAAEDAPEALKDAPEAKEAPAAEEAEEVPAPEAEQAPVAEATPAAEADGGASPENQAEPASEPAQDDNQADASAQAETAEANPKED